MRVLAILGFIWVLTTGVFAQGSNLSGNVRERVITAPDHGKKVVAKDAAVKLTSINDAAIKYSTNSDADGNFRFENIPAGEYVLSSSRPYKDTTMEVRASKRISLKKGETRNENLLLEYYLTGSVGIGVMLPEERVTVIASGTRQRENEISKTVNTIEGQEMRDRADFSLAESLRTIPGFRVAQSGGFGRIATIKTRGLRNQDTAILIDGIRFRDASAITGDASSFLSDFTLTSVSRVEVLRGSGSSLYGTNAVGGTVDFQTPTARSGTHGQIGGAFGGLGLGRFRGNISHGTDDGKFGINGGVSRTVYTEGIDGQDDAHNTNFQTRVDVNPFSRTGISGRIFFSDADVRLNSNPDTAGTPPLLNSTIIDARANVNFVPDINDPDSFQKSRFFSGQIVVNQVITDDLVLSGYYQGLTTKRTNDNGALGIGFQSASNSVFDGDIHTGNAHLKWTPGTNQLMAGYEFESEKFGNDGRTPDAAGNFFTIARQKSNTFYVQDILSLSEGRLMLTGSMRVQAYRLGQPEFSLVNAPYTSLALDNPPTAYTFDGAALYYFRNSGTKLRAHVGNGYRVPSLYERFGTFFSTFGTPEFVALGDPFLRPEKTTAFDLGVEQTLSRERVKLSATYFYTRLNEIIGFGNVVPNIGTTVRPFGGYENQKGGTARGGEFSATLKPTTSTDIFTSYTFTDSEQLIPQVSGSGILKTLGVPDHQFTLVATQRFKRFWVNFDFLATSAYLAPIFDTNAFTFQTYVYRFKGNRKGGVTAGYTFGFRQDKMSLRIYGTVENVFDQEYFENGFRTSGATGRVGLTFGF